MARWLRTNLENCYLQIKRYTVSGAAEERKNPEFRKRTLQPRKVQRREISGRVGANSVFSRVFSCNRLQS